MNEQEQITLQRELKSLQVSQPHLSFKQAWDKLQSEKSWLFTDGSTNDVGSASTSALLSHNNDIRKKVDELMAFARGERPAVDRRMLVQAGGQAWYLDEYDNPIGTLAQQLDEMERHGKRNNQEAGSR